MGLPGLRLLGRCDDPLGIKRIGPGFGHDLDLHRIVRRAQGIVFSLVEREVDVAEYLVLASPDRLHEPGANGVDLRKSLMDPGQRDVQDEVPDVLGLGDPQDSGRVPLPAEFRQLELDDAR
jgi:hypothetical protein